MWLNLMAGQQKILIVDIDILYLKPFKKKKKKGEGSFTIVYFL